MSNFPDNDSLLQNLKLIESPDSTYLPQDSKLVFHKASGSFVFDVEGNAYLDLCAGFGALPFGHNPDFFKDYFVTNFAKIFPGITHGMGDVYPSLSKIKLLNKLKSFLPNHLQKGSLAVTGGQAVELALKTAILHTKKSGFVVFDEAYHGLDLGVLPTTSREDFRKPFASWWLNGGQETNILRLPYGIDKETLEKQIAMNLKNNFAAILVEPIQGRAGVRLPPSDWLQDLLSVTQKNSALLIFDEVLVGFGRTGRDFFCRSVPADLVCLGKALGSGMPISACFGTGEVMNSWPESEGEALHTGTFFGHPLSCELAFLNLCEIEKSQIFSKVQDKAAKIKAILLEYFKNDPYFTSIDGEGLMLGVHFSKPGHAAFLMDRLRSKKILVLPSGKTGQTLSITPALNIDENDVKHFFTRATTVVGK